jgi:oligopeptide transport system permease protein
LGRFILRRLLALIPLLWVIVTVTFFLMRLAPGGPFDKDRRLPPEIERNLRVKYNLDWPLWKQYLQYLGPLNLTATGASFVGGDGSDVWGGVVTGDFGPSFRYERGVTEIIAEGFPVSLHLGLMALSFALLFGILPGVIAAVRQNTIWDHLPMSVTMLGVSIPNFVLGPLLILVFSLTLFWLPPARWDGPRYWILPTITLGAMYAAYIARLTRGGMLEVVRQDFARTARAKGLPERTILLRHTLRGGLLPVISFLGPATARLLTGSIVVEKIFLVPGLGRYFIDGAVNRDYTLVLGVVVFYSALLIVLNLVVDVLYGFLDPRVTYE